jgi:hypothetical protein
MPQPCPEPRGPNARLNRLPRDLEKELSCRQRVGLTRRERREDRLRGADQRLLGLQVWAPVNRHPTGQGERAGVRPEVSRGGRIGQALTWPDPSIARR